MENYKMEVALEIIQLKIIDFIKNNKGKDVKEFTKKLRELTEEREKIYELDEETMDKVYNVYLKELKEKG